MTETKPTGYEQGYRDALLTARSLLLATLQVDVALLGLNDMIDSKNHDLWNLLALVQAPSSVPSAQALRAPFGAVMDDAGRILFLRVPNASRPGESVDYDTGVTALLAQVQRTP